MVQMQSYHDWLFYRPASIAPYCLLEDDSLSLSQGKVPLTPLSPEDASKGYLAQLGVWNSRQRAPNPTEDSYGD